MNPTLKTWLHGLASAAIGAVGAAVPLVIVAPDTFNFTHAGWVKLGQVCLTSAVIAAAAYLSKSPLP